MRVCAWPLAGAAAVAMLLGGCSVDAAPSQDLARDLSGKVDVDGMYVHLRKLQEIADANNDTRAEGTPGYDASVDYVAQTLRDKGFDVQTPEFERLGVTRPGKPTLTVSGRDYPVDQASLLTPTPAGGLRAVTLRPQKAAGCVGGRLRHQERSTGAIAVVDDTGCSSSTSRTPPSPRARSGFSSSAIRRRRAARRGCSRPATTRA